MKKTKIIRVYFDIISSPEFVESLEFTKEQIYQTLPVFEDDEEVTNILLNKLNIIMEEEKQIIELLNVENQDFES